MDNPVLDNPYYIAAQKLGLKCQIILPEHQYFQIQQPETGKQLLVMYASISANSQVSYHTARNKLVTHKLVRQAGLPTPAYVCLSKDDFVSNNWASKLGQIKFPWVVKPLSELQARHVKCNITSLSEAEISLKQLFQTKHRALVEQQVPGTDYRILVFDDQVISVLRRIPAHVVGDGQSTIQQLVDQKNLQLSADPHGHAIVLDDEVDRYLSLHHYQLDSVPQAGQRVKLRRQCTAGIGGETELVKLSNIHPDNLELAKQAARSVELRLAGIDFITPDITQSWHDNQAVINEVNSAPDIKIHYRQEIQQSLSPTSPKKILQLYFQI